MGKVDTNLALHDEGRDNILRFTPPEIKGNIVVSDVPCNGNHIDFLRHDFKEFALRTVTADIGSKQSCYVTQSLSSEQIDNPNLL
jgi:hypothetical protein